MCRCRCDNLLHQGLGRCRFLARRNADRAFDPGTGCALDIIVHLAAAAAIPADNVAMAVLAEIVEVLARHHAAIVDDGLERASFEG